MIKVEDWYVKECLATQVNGVDVFDVRMEKPDGMDMIHRMPRKVIEYRAAEYDIDPSTEEGKQQIFDIMLHEPFVEEDEDVVRRASTGNPRKDDPVNLWSAPSRAQARDAHLARIETAKRTKVNVVWDKNPARSGSPRKPKGPVVDSACRSFLDHPVDQEFMNMHKTIVRLTRHQLGAQVLPNNELPPRKTGGPTHLDDGIVRRNKVLEREAKGLPEEDDDQLTHAQAMLAGKREMVPSRKKKIKVRKRQR